MKKHFHLIALFTFLFAFTVSAQTIQPSGNIISKDYDHVGFDGLNISTDFNAVVTKGDKISVRIECDDNLVPYILVENKGGVLHVRHQNSMGIRGKETLIAHITMPQLNSVNGSADAIIELKNNFDSQNMTIDLSGDSVMKGEISVGNLNVKLRGDSYLKVRGTANNVNARLRGDSEIKYFDFIVKDLNLDLDGDSIAELTVENSMSIELDGDSEMRYKGSPKIIRQSIRGDSDVTKLN